MSAPPLRFERVTRWYGPVAGLLEVSCTFSAGVVGLLGPNGAGKSTMLNLAAGLIRPGMGKAEVFGKSPFFSSRARAQMGLMPETEAFPPGMKGREFLKSCLAMAGVPLRGVGRRVDELLEMVDLVEAASRRVEGYSRGMKQRLKLAQALGHDPELLLLDEPLTGLDPLARRQVIQLIHRLGDQEKRCVIVSSHVLHEVESMTSEVVFIHQGRILAQGDVHQIRSHLADQPVKVRIRSSGPRFIAGAIVNWPSLLGFRLGEGYIDVEALDPDEFFDALGRLACTDPVDIEEIQMLDEGLDAVFDYLVE